MQINSVTYLIKCEVQNCEYAKLATYKVRNKNAKVNICIRSSAKNWRCVQCEWKCETSQ